MRRQFEGVAPSQIIPPPKPVRTLQIVSAERDVAKRSLDQAIGFLNYAESFKARLGGECGLDTTIKKQDEIINSKGYKYYNERAFGVMGKLPFGEGQRWRDEAVKDAIERKNQAIEDKNRLLAEFKKFSGKSYEEWSEVHEKLNGLIKSRDAVYKKLDKEWQPLDTAQRTIERQAREQAEQERRQIRQPDVERNPEKYRGRGYTR